MNKTDAYRNRRYKRLLARMDAADGHFDDEGHWVTTHETKRRIHINENGIPDKGNPYIIAKMTGTKPKLSGAYRKKSLQESLGKGDVGKTVHSLKSLPEGSTIKMANGTEYTKTGSGFVSSKSKTGGKQTPQALAKILDGHAKAGKNFEINPSDVGGGAEATKNTGAPKPGQGAPDQAAQDIKSKMMSTMSAAMASQDIGGVQEVVEMFEQLPVGSVVTDVYGSEYKKLPNGEFEDTSIPLSSFSSVDMPSIVKTAISKGGEVGITLPEDGTGSSTPISPAQAKDALQSAVDSHNFDDIVSALKDIPDGSVLEFVDAGLQYQFKKQDGKFVEKDIGETHESSLSGWLTSVPAYDLALPEESEQGAPDQATPASEQVKATPVSAESTSISPEVAKFNDILSGWAGHYVGGPMADEGIAAAKALKDGTIISVNGKDTYKKVTEHSMYGDFPWFENLETGQESNLPALKKHMGEDNVQAVQVKDPVDDTTFSASTSGQEPTSTSSPDPSTEQSGSSSGGKTMKDLMESLKKYPTTMEGANQFWGEVKSTFENAPDGTEITFPDEAGEKWVKETHGGLPQWVNPASGDTMHDADMVQSFMDSDFGADPDNISAGITYKEPTGAGTPGSSSSAPSSPVSQDYSGQKEALKNLIKNGHNASITPYEKVLDELPEGTIIKVGGKKYEKDPTGDWIDSDTGLPLGESWDVGYELEHNNPQHTLDISIPGEANTTASASSVSGPAGQSGSVSAALSGVKSIADKLQNGKYVSLSDFKNACKSMKDGDGIVMNGKTYIKDTDSSGNPVFHPSDSPQHTYNPTGVMDIMSYQIGLQKHGLSDGVSFKSGSDQSSSGSTTSASPSAATPSPKPSAAAKDTQKSIKNAKTKAAVASALDALPVGTKIHMKNQGETVFTKTEHGFSKETKFWNGTIHALTDDVVKYVHGKNKFAAPFAIEDTSGGTTKFSDGTDYQPSTSSGASASSPSPKAVKNGGIGAAVKSVVGKVKHAAECFTAARKNAAHWDKTGGAKTDKLLRPIISAVWKKMSPAEKDAAYSYTDGSFSPMNKALREGSNVSSDIGDKIKHLTNAIDRCEAPTDMWLQRGTDMYALSKLFNVPLGTLNSAKSKGDEGFLAALTSNQDIAQDKAFLSCGSSKGKGFGGEVILNLYCPKGTKMMYAEPFSLYGLGDGKSWDGNKGQTGFSSENETILQRGTQMVPTKVHISGGMVYIDVDVVGQDY